MNKLKLENLPQKPGCYLFSNKKGKVIYVGKAKDLRSRVRSYFNAGSDLSLSKQEMLKEITGLETIIVNNETEALLLETNLIKKYRPKYNVVMKDDKNFCYLKISDSDNPQLFIVRQLEKGTGNKYLGPYLSAANLRALLKLLNYYDSPKEQKQNTKDIVDFLGGKTQPVIHRLQKKMNQAAREKNFELAALLRDRLIDIQRITTRQTIITPAKINQDVISLWLWRNYKIINLFRIRQGKLLDKININLKTALSEKGEIIKNFIDQYYQSNPDLPQDIILPQTAKKFITKIIKTDSQDINIKFFQKGKYRTLIRLGEINAQQFLRAQIPNFTKTERNDLDALEKLREKLKINNFLERIECYDISNLQGSYAVGAMVTFTNGLPDKSQYRRFGIKYTKNINDFAMLSEIVARRFRHSDWPWPQLIVIDGGKGQLSAVLKTLRSAGIKIPTIALAKKNEEIFLLNKQRPLLLKPGSDELFLLQRIRDEAHRFAITFYRQRHRRGSLISPRRSMPKTEGKPSRIDK